MNTPLTYSDTPPLKISLKEAEHVFGASPKSVRNKIALGIVKGEIVGNSILTWPHEVTNLRAQDHVGNGNDPLTKKVMARIARAKRAMEGGLPADEDADDDAMAAST